MAAKEEAFEGLKILDITKAIAGPLLTEYLAQHGATVVRIESKHSPDLGRHNHPFKDGKPGMNRSTYFAAYSANKASIGLDLNHPRAGDVIKRLVGWCDVLVENLTPGRMDKWGWGYAELAKTKPGLIMLSTSSTGGNGSQAVEKGFGYSLVALSGYTSITGWPDRQPCQPYLALTDFIAPCMGAIALISAMEYCRRTGKGQHIDVSQYESGVYPLSPLAMDYFFNGRVAGPMGNRSEHFSPHGAYPCSGDDRWCVIAVEDENQWIALCKAMGKPELADDPLFSSLDQRKKHEDDIDRILGQWTSQRDARKVMEVLQQAEVACGVCQDPSEIFSDIQLRHRNHFQILEHVEIGPQNYEMPPFRLSVTPAKLKSAAPCFQQDSAHFYTKVIGMPDEEFLDLLSEGVLS